MPFPIFSHIEGRDLASRGQRVEAIAKLRKADDEATYAGESAGLFKLYNRLVLADLLEAEGKSAEAAAVRASVDAVNPHFANRVATMSSAP